MLDESINYCRFAVNEKPYCFWIPDMASVRKQFLASISPDYWFLSSEMLRKNDNQYEQIIAIHARFMYLTALESMFALLFASLQVPELVLAWLNLYSKNDILSLISKVNSGKQFYTKVDLSEFNWPSISRLIHTGLDNEEAQMKLCKYLGLLANDFSKKDNSDELNSIKHGCRFQKGGFQLSVGVQDGYGIPASPDKLIPFGGSETGMTYYCIDRICHNKMHYSIKKHSVNWTFNSCITKLELVAQYINNIRVFLHNVNHISDDNLEFLYPLDEDEVDDSLKFTGPMNFKVGYQVNEHRIKLLSATEILSEYEKPRFTRSIKGDKL